MYEISIVSYIANQLLSFFKMFNVTFIAICTDIFRNSISMELLFMDVDQHYEILPNIENIIRLFFKEGGCEHIAKADSKISILE